MSKDYMITPGKLAARTIAATRRCQRLWGQVLSITKLAANQAEATTYLTKEPWCVHDEQANLSIVALR